MFKKVSHEFTFRETLNLLATSGEDLVEHDRIIPDNLFSVLVDSKNHSVHQHVWIFILL